MSDCEPEDCEVCGAERVSPEYRAALNRALDKIGTTEFPIHGEYRKCDHGYHHPFWVHSCDGCYGCDVPAEYRRDQ